MIQDTSIKAYKEDALPTLGERQAQFLKALEALGEATNSEIAVHLNWSINRVTPRCVELRAMGKVIGIGKRKCSVTGRLAYVWTLKANQQKLL